MVGVQRIECATLRVRDVERSVAFYRDVMGLVEFETGDETTYLGCGLDGTYDLAIKPGETSLESVSFRMTDIEFDRQLELLEKHGIETHRQTGPGHSRGVYFDLPRSGATLGFVVVEDTRYVHPADATHFLDSAAPIADGRSAVAPLNLDHIGLVSPDVKAESEFLEETVDFIISDAKAEDDDSWANSFIRYDNHHHDISLFQLDPADTHHHLAWALPDVSQMKQFADRLVQNGGELELGFVRHGPGGNISYYFKEPSGHRFEYATEVSTLDADTPPGIYDGSRRPPEEGISLWGGVTRPESFKRGT